MIISFVYYSTSATADVTTDIVMSMKNTAQTGLDEYFSGGGTSDLDVIWHISNSLQMTPDSLILAGNVFWKRITKMRLPHMFASANRTRLIWHEIRAPIDWLVLYNPYYLIVA